MSNLTRKPQHLTYGYGVLVVFHRMPRVRVRVHTHYRWRVATPAGPICPMCTIATIHTYYTQLCFGYAHNVLT